MAEFLKLTKLTIYVGEDFFYKDKPFYKAIFDIAGKYKIAGCTVIRGSNLSLRRMTYIHRRLLTNQALRLQNIVCKVVLIVFVLPKVRFIHNSLSVPVWEVIIIRLAEDQKAASAVR